MPHFTYSDLFNAGTLIVVLGLYRKMSIIVYQHSLMWKDFAVRKGLDPSGKKAPAEV